jgi:hypothetical protein
VRGESGSGGGGRAVIVPEIVRAIFGEAGAGIVAVGAAEGFVVVAVFVAAVVAVMAMLVFDGMMLLVWIGGVFAQIGRVVLIVVRHFSVVGYVGFCKLNCQILCLL